MKSALVTLALAALLSTWAKPAQASDGDEFFEKKVRPILVEHCAKCHGDEKPKGGLKLTSRDHLLKGGDTGPAAVAGKPEESLIVAAVRYLDEPAMPPKAKLPDADIATLTKWVEMGLPWPAAKEEASATVAKPSQAMTLEEAKRSWAFQSPKEPPIPPVKAADWAQNEIDRFILAKMEAAGLKPAPKADKRTLIRRSTFDLTGLPPTPDEVNAFLNDESPDAYAKLIDRLLATPAYGERWARRWLDIVRYADSLDARGTGSPGDILDAWRYRDWVIESLNADMPYDKFVRYQVAGDLLPPDSPAEGSDGFNRSGTIATTMLAIGNWGNGDADKEKILTDIADDQVDVMSKAFLGLTVSCARCHDHKFDPISQKDYYGLAGIFFSTRILPNLTPKGAGESIIRVPLIAPAEMARREARDKAIAALEKGIAERRNQAAKTLAAEMKPLAGRYLLAAYDFRSKPDQGAIEEFAKARNLQPFALKQWVQSLGGAEPKALTTKTENVGGIAQVFAWTGPGTAASATANTTTLAQQILTFRLPPRSINVHPGPTSATVVSWTSPITGKVRITGRLADGDSACGNGVGWAIEHRSPLGMIELCSGDVANGSTMAFGQSATGEALNSVIVNKGDRIDLVVSPKADYSCDTTMVDLVISEWDGPGTWDLTRDCVDTFHAGNPHADRQGHPDVWQFGELSGPRTPGGPMALALAEWRKAITGKVDRTELEKAAESLGKAFPLDDENSPFWIRDPAADVALPENVRAELADQTAELAKLKAQPVPPIEFANGAQDGGVPNGSHAGTHDVKVHLRGRYDRLGDLVPRHFPVVLAGDTQPAISNGSGRLELARWLTLPDNPLTARVLVNRLWQGHFGEGLIRTPSNFGKLGDKPSHPELIDWLSRELVKRRWSLKAMHRLIMLSSTYQQSSTPRADDLRVDGDNRLLSRQNRRRLEAEAIRDNLLAAAGRLDRQAGGPADRDAASARRGIYQVTIRSDRATVAALFDQADSTAPVDRRVESTVAPQSLYLINHPFVLSQAEGLAKSLLAMPVSDRDRIIRAYEILYGRTPGEEEIAVGVESIKPNGEPAEVAWKSYCHVLLCANEFIYID